MGVAKGGNVTNFALRLLLIGSAAKNKKSQIETFKTLFHFFIFHDIYTLVKHFSKIIAYIKNNKINYKDFLEYDNLFYKMKKNLLFG